MKKPAGGAAHRRRRFRSPGPCRSAAGPSATNRGPCPRPSRTGLRTTRNAWYRVEAHWGPVRRRLAEFELHGLVGGPRGELSGEFARLVKRVAAIGASRIGSQLPVASGTTADAILMWHATCRLGIAIQRASAEHLLDRIGYATPGGAHQAAYDAARDATFGMDGPSGVADRYRDTRYATASSSSPWLDAGMTAT